MDTQLAPMELSKDEIELLLGATSSWRENFDCGDEDWSDLEALQTKLQARLEELRSIPPALG